MPASASSSALPSPRSSLPRALRLPGKLRPGAARWQAETDYGTFCDVPAARVQGLPLLLSCRRRLRSQSRLDKPGARVPPTGDGAPRRAYPRQALTAAPLLLSVVLIGWRNGSGEAAVSSQVTARGGYRRLSRPSWWGRRGGAVGGAVPGAGGRRAGSLAAAPAQAAGGFTIRVGNLPNGGAGQPGRQPDLRHRRHGRPRDGDHPPVSRAGAWPARYCSRRARILRLK